MFRALLKFVFWIIGIILAIAIIMIYFKVDFSAGQGCQSQVLADCVQNGSPIFLRNTIFFGYSAVYTVFEKLEVTSDPAELAKSADGISQLIVGVYGTVSWLWGIIVSQLSKA